MQPPICQARILALQDLWRRPPYSLSYCPARASWCKSATACSVELGLSRSEQIRPTPTLHPASALNSRPHTPTSPQHSTQLFVTTTAATLHIHSAAIRHFEVDVTPLLAFFSRLLPDSSWPPCSSITVARIHPASFCCENLCGGLVRGVISTIGYEIKHSRIKGRVLVESCWIGDGSPIFFFPRCANSIRSEAIVSEEHYTGLDLSLVPSQPPCEAAAPG